jgi:hypothetical protein
MKRLKLFLILPFLVLLLHGAYTGVLTSTPQNLTTSWVDLGGEIDVGTKKFNTIHLWVTLDINDSNNIRFKILDKWESAGADEYERATISTSANVLYVEPTYYEFNIDEDKKYHFVFGLDNVTPYVQIQVQVGTAGATPAQIDAAYYSLGY